MASDGMRHERGQDGIGQDRVAYGLAYSVRSLHLHLQSIAFKGVVRLDA